MICKHIHLITLLKKAMIVYLTNIQVFFDPNKKIYVLIKFSHLAMRFFKFGNGGDDTRLGVGGRHWEASGCVAVCCASF